MFMHIKKGDNVKVLTGKDKGKTGKVLRALPREERVIIEGVNVQKRHERARRANQKGQVVERPAPIHVSNVMLADQAAGRPVRAVRKRGKEIETGTEK